VTSSIKSAWLTRRLVNVFSRLHFRPIQKFDQESVTAQYIIPERVSSNALWSTPYGRWPWYRDLCYRGSRTDWFLCCLRQTDIQKKPLKHEVMNLLHRSDWTIPGTTNYAPIILHEYTVWCCCWYPTWTYSAPTTILKNDMAKFKAALRKYLHTWYGP